MPTPTDPPANQSEIVRELARYGAVNRIADLIGELRRLHALFPGIHIPELVPAQPQTPATPKPAKPKAAKNATLLERVMKKQWQARQSTKKTKTATTRRPMITITDQVRESWDTLGLEGLSFRKAAATIVKLVRQRSHHTISQAAAMGAYYTVRKERLGQATTKPTTKPLTKPLPKPKTSDRAGWTPERRQKMQAYYDRKRRQTTVIPSADTISVGPGELAESILTHPEMPNVDPADGHVELSPERVLAPIVEAHTDTEPTETPEN